LGGESLHVVTTARIVAVVLARFREHDVGRGERPCRRPAEDALTALGQAAGPGKDVARGAIIVLA
jgi:hypothetical protein